MYIHYIHIYTYIYVYTYMYIQINIYIYAACIYRPYASPNNSKYHHWLSQAFWEWFFITKSNGQPVDVTRSHRQATESTGILHLVTTSRSKAGFGNGKNMLFIGNCCRLGLSTIIQKSIWNGNPIGPPSLLNDFIESIHHDASQTNVLINHCHQISFSSGFNPFEISKYYFIFFHFPRSCLKWNMLKPSIFGAPLLEISHPHFPLTP